MRNKIFILLLLGAVTAYAQSGRTTDFGGIASTEIGIGLGGPFQLSVEEELRCNHDFARFDRWLNSVGVDYTCLNNHINIGLTADYIRRHNKRDYYENRSRLGLQVTYTEKYRRLKFRVRSKATFTFLDERTGEHRVNPRLYWRNRLKITYHRPKSRFKYALSTELFWLTNDPKKGYIDNLRTTLSMDYRLTRNYSLSAFVRMDNDLQVKEPVDRFFLGMTLKVKY